MTYSKRHGNDITGGQTATFGYAAVLPRDKIHVFVAMLNCAAKPCHSKAAVFWSDPSRCSGSVQCHQGNAFTTVHLRSGMSPMINVRIVPSIRALSCMQIPNGIIVSSFGAATLSLAPTAGTACHCTGIGQGTVVDRSGVDGGVAVTGGGGGVYGGRGRHLER